jgi:hypothetical protein
MIPHGQKKRWKNEPNPESITRLREEKRKQLENKVTA